METGAADAAEASGARRAQQEEAPSIPGSSALQPREPVCKGEGSRPTDAEELAATTARLRRLARRDGPHQAGPAGEC